MRKVKRQRIGGEKTQHHLTDMGFTSPGAQQPKEKNKSMSLKFIDKKNANNQQVYAEVSQRCRSKHQLRKRTKTRLPFSHIRPTKLQKMDNEIRDSWSPHYQHHQWDYRFEKLIWIYASTNYRNSLKRTLGTVTYRKKRKHNWIRGTM